METKVDQLKPVDADTSKAIDTTACKNPSSKTTQLNVPDATSQEVSALVVTGNSTETPEGASVEGSTLYELLDPMHELIAEIGANEEVKDRTVLRDRSGQPLFSKKFHSDEPLKTAYQALKDFEEECAMKKWKTEAQTEMKRKESSESSPEPAPKRAKTSSEE